MDSSINGVGRGEKGSEMGKGRGSGDIALLKVAVVLMEVRRGG